MVHRGRKVSRGSDQSPCRGGVIWNGIPYETSVIPAKAGIQSAGCTFPKVCRVDSRFRGNDCNLHRRSRNYTGTPAQNSCVLLVKTSIVN